MKPRGRDQVRSAVLAATSELVAERGPDGFSVREIAARAGVNHALVHRHFGTKADVLEQMLAADAESVAGAVIDSGVPLTPGTGAADVERLLRVLADRPSYWRTLVQAILDSPETAVPGTASTTELFAGLWRDGVGDDTGDGGAVQSSLAAVTVLGWLIFGDFMSESTGADVDDLRRAVAAHVSTLLGPDQAR